MTWKYFLLATVGCNVALATVTAVGCGGGGGSATGGSTTTSSTTHTLTHTTTTNMTTTTTTSVGNLGASCMMDTDCGGGGLTCALPTAVNPVFGGGPVNGYCTMSCMADSDCPTGGACLTNASGSSGTCVLTCTQGNNDAGPSYLNSPIGDMTKCLARTDVACATLSQSESVCLPVCGEDSQCPSGMHCDPAAAVCVMTANTGLANGKPCSVDGGTDPCAGICLDIGLGGSASVSICSQECELGVDPTVVQTPSAWSACGGIKNGLCAYSSQGEAAGDLGFCTNACNVQSDCYNPDFWCFAITNITGTMGIKNGWCLGSIPCPNGSSDCAEAPMGAVCTQTAYGPQCLPPTTTIPLGSAAPDAGTTATDAGTGGTGGGASDASTD